MIYITGDTHAEFSRFTTKRFPDQREMTRNDFVIICGDFGGVWYDNSTERYNLKQLARRNPTFLFADGNHENFDRLNGEFPVVDFHGGKAHKIRENIYHLMRGYVYELEGKTFFVFGGARSHDIQDGIIDPAEYPSLKEAVKDYNFRTLHLGEMLRIKGLSWWKQELPTQEEMDRGIENLKRYDFKVDYVISHCCPTFVATLLGFKNPDKLTDYFQSLIFDHGLQFCEWHFGHYHRDVRVNREFFLHYERIERLL
jgi:hypothetical protein